MARPTKEQQKAKEFAKAKEAPAKAKQARIAAAERRVFINPVSAGSTSLSQNQTAQVDTRRPIRLAVDEQTRLITTLHEQINTLAQCLESALCNSDADSGTEPGMLAQSDLEADLNSHNLLIRSAIRRVSDLVERCQL